MKATITKTKKAALVMLLAAGMQSIAQNTNENIVPRIGGFGMKFSLLGMEDLGFTTNPVGGKTFFVSVNPVKNFRIEPEFGFAKTTSPGPSGTSVGDLTSKGSSYGGSLYYMFQKGNANIYVGPGLNAAKYLTEFADWMPGTTGAGTYKKSTRESKYISYGLTLGAEYFFNRHFSLGSEVSCKASKSQADVSVSDESTSLFTAGNLVFRAYF